MLARKLIGCALGTNLVVAGGSDNGVLLHGSRASKELQAFRQPHGGWRNLLLSQLLDLELSGRLSIPSELTTYTRTTAVRPVTMRGDGGDQISSFAADTWAYQWHAQNPHPSGVGMHCDGGATNIFANTDGGRVAINGTSPTITNNNATAPDGNTVATSVSGVTNEGCRQPQVAISASTAYVYSCWLKATSATALNVQLRAQKTFSSGTFYGTSNKQIDDTWTRYYLAFSSGVGETTCSAEVKLLEDGAFEIAHGQLETGSIPSTWIFTSGASASRDELDAEIAGMRDAGYLNNDRGDIRCGAIFAHHNNTAAKLWVLKAILTNVDRKECVVSGTSLVSALWNSAGIATNTVTQAISLTVDQLYHQRFLWDEDEDQITAEHSSGDRVTYDASSNSAVYTAGTANLPLGLGIEPQVSGNVPGCIFTYWQIHDEQGKLKP